jgi:hypothetical protein
MFRRWMLLPLAVAGFVAAAIISSQEPEKPAGARMTDAAERFLASLNADQKARAVFAFDDKERTNWNFVPLQDKQGKPTRKGLRLEEMTAEQKKLALELVRAGTSKDGFTQATTIMSLESILADLEKSRGGLVRNPEWYFFSVFGTPGKTGKWGWRVEGHHLSLNFTLDGNKVIGATPYFFGANPAEVKAGDRKGLRTLPEAEDFARDLFESLTDEQKKVAFQPKQFPEIEQGKPIPNVGAPLGLPAAKMDDKQKAILQKLLKGYLGRMPPDVADVERAALLAAGVEKIHFAFAREDAKPGKPYTYRVQGPTFVIEFLNVQSDSANNPANHIHSAWRNVKGDFGTAP